MPGIFQSGYNTKIVTYISWNCFYSMDEQEERCPNV